jgi:outer membrane protein TolC
MMKKQLAAILAILLLLGVPVQAAAATVPPQTVTVRYSDIETTVRSNNQTIRANAKSLDSLSDNDVIQEKQQELSDSSAALSNVNKMLQDAYTAINTTPAASTAEQQAISASLQGSMASISAIRSILDSQSSQMDVDDDTIEKTDLQMQEAADQIVIAAQQLYVSFHYLDTQRTQLTQNLSLANDSLTVSQKRYDLGLITSTELLNSQQSSKSISSKIAALVLEMQTAKNNFSVLLGYSKDYDVSILSLPDVDQNFISKMNYDADYQTALTENMTLKLKQKDKDIADDNRDEDSNTKDDDYPDSTIEDYQAASLNYRMAVNTFDASFRRSYDEISNKQVQLETENSSYQAKMQNFNMQTKKYNIGLISSFDLKNAQQEANTQKVAVEQAKINLFSAVEQYRWALKGIVSQSAN